MSEITEAELVAVSPEYGVSLAESRAILAAIVVAENANDFDALSKLKAPRRAILKATQALRDAAVAKLLAAEGGAA